MTAKTILIMAGGTGGHVFPALAVAEELRGHGWNVVWLGTRRGIEARLVPAANIPIEWLDISGLRGKGKATMVLAPFKLLRACWQAQRIIRKVQPDVVLGMGGFASGPGGLMTRVLKKPLVIHEQNSVAGMTNRWLARVASKVLEAFPETLPRAEVVGNPVRDSVRMIPAPATRLADREGPVRILVLGGSQGARALNEILPSALAEVEVPVEVRHQCGRSDPDTVASAYSTAGIAAEVLPFIDDVAASYAWADIAVCRSGAMTVFEVAAAGLAAIFVPFPHAVDDHQTGNAEYLVDAGAADIIQEHDMTPSRLAETLRRRITSREVLRKMAEAARSKAMPDSGERVAARCIETADAWRAAA